MIDYIEPTAEQRAILEAAGWKWDAGLGPGYKCRVCHDWTGYGIAAWVSPKLAFYHVHCVLKSAQVKMLLRKAVGE